MYNTRTLIHDIELNSKQMLHDISKVYMVGPGKQQTRSTAGLGMGWAREQSRAPDQGVAQERGGAREQGWARECGGHLLI